MLVLVLLLLLFVVSTECHESSSQPSSSSSSVWLPVPLTVVPVNVQVGGLADNTLSQWLLHSLHTSPVVHTAWTGDGFNSTTSHDVQYRYDIKVVTVAPSVQDALSARLRRWTRRGGVDLSGRDVWCVEAFHVEDLLSQLAATLRPHTGAVPHSPFLFLLHPNLTTTMGGPVAAEDRVYGYRGGLCPADLRIAGHDATVLDEVQWLAALDSKAARRFAGHGEEEEDPDHDAGGGAAAAGPRPVLNYEDDVGDDDGGDPSWNRTTVEVVDAVSVSEEWAGMVLKDDAQQWDTFTDLSVPELALTLLRNADARRSRTVLEQLRIAATSPVINNKGDDTSSSLPLLEGSNTGDFVRSGLSSVISDAMVGAGRVAWLDVGAEFLDWSPSVGTHSVRAQRRVSVLEAAEDVTNSPTLAAHSHFAVGDRVSAAVSSFLHQVVAPPWATVGAVQPPTGSTTPRPVARVAYTIFLVDVHSPDQEEEAGPGGSPPARMPASGARSAKHVQHTEYNPLGGDGLNVDMLKRELMRAALPHQEVSVTVHVLAIDDDPAVAMAYAVGMRHSQVMRVPPETGSPVFEEQPFLDSAVVADLLSSSSGLSSMKRQVGAAVTLNVPIFVFSVDSHPPVLVDKWFTARASHGVVVATQGSQLAWPTSRTIVNGAEHVLNLRNPAKSALLAALQLSGGVVPSHVSATGQDWRWVAGAAATSTIGASAGAVSGFMKDSMRRATVATVLLNVTGALAASTTATRRRGGGNIDWAARGVVQSYASAVAAVRSTQKAVLAHVQVGDMKTAMGLLSELAARTDDALNTSAILAEAQAASRCAPKGLSTLTQVWIGAGSVLAVIVAILSVRSLIFGWLDRDGRFGGPPKLHIN